MAQHANMVLDGHVRLVRQLGQGGMGTLWVAYDDRLEREVAVKFITPEALEKNPGLKERFKREAVAAARIRSPYVVQIHSHGEQEDGTPYMVMELLHGESLGERVERGQRLSFPQCADVLSQVGKALAAAHKLGLVHRDIKPDNIFLLEGDDIFVKLLDFGIAKHSELPESASNLTATGSVLGTPHYMSPEQLLDTKGVDHRADLWALGVVGYIMVTGALPFVGETLAATIVAITSFNYAPPSTRGAPKAFDDWFGRAFHRSVDQRFQNAKEMADAFVDACRKQAAGPQAASALTRPGYPAGVPVAPPASTVQTPHTPHFTPQHTPPPQTIPSQPPGAPDPRMMPTPPHGGFDINTRPSAVTATISQPPPPMPMHPQTFAGSSSTLSGEKKTSASKVVGILLAAAVAGGGVVAGLLYLRPSKNKSGAASAASAASTTTSAKPKASETAPDLPPPPDGMVAIAAGKYDIGCNKGTHPGCFEDEGPMYRAELDAFAIMTHEVTMGDYDVCIAAGKCPPAGTDDGCTWQSEGHEKHPINCVGVEAAKAYCASKGWRLPTEQEWEAAARKDESTRYPWGSDAPTCDLTVMKAKKAGCGSGEVVSAGSRDQDKSHVGVFDMGGNVREWTSSPYDAYPGGKKDKTRSGIVNRGGSFEMGAKELSSVYTRNVDAAGEKHPGIGFRCAADLK